MISNLFAGGGEMGKRMENLDWENTALGPPENWERSLITAVRIVLTCRQPMFVWWGAEFINLYNDAYRPILGKKEEHALARPARELWAEIWDEIGPRAESALLKDEGTFDEDLLLIMKRHGFAEETYYTFSYSPVPNDQGGTGGIICACTEETRRKIGDRELALLRELAVASGDGESVGEVCRGSAEALAGNPFDLPFGLIYVMAPEHGKFRLAGHTGIQPGDPAAPEFLDVENDQPVWPVIEVTQGGDIVVVPDPSEKFDVIPKGAWDRVSHVAAMVPIGAGGRVKRPGILVAGLNPYRPLDEDYSSFLRLIASQIAAGIARAEDFEQEKQRVQSLEELDRAKTTFFSNISHEFRTPLTLIMGPLQELRDWISEKSDSGDVNSLIETVDRNSRRLLKLVNTLLDFSRIEAGRVEASFEECDLAQLTADLASSFEATINGAGLGYEIDCQFIPEPTFVDRDMWEKIVLNLISNAFKYTLEGKITVRLHSGENSAVLKVEDTGIGIPKSEIPFLFDRFHRVEGSQGRTQEGSGIGLALVKELLQFHEGSIEVDSEKGRGTVFTVRIPYGSEHLDEGRIVADASPGLSGGSAGIFVEEALRWIPGSSKNAEIEDHSSVLPVSEDARTGSRPRLLVIDDNADMREYFERLLSPAYDLNLIGDGRKALELIKSVPPDLVLSDVMMPGLDGFELLREIRSDANISGIPVILVSARKGEEARIEGIAAGADDYMTKPFSSKELVARVSGALELAKLRQKAQAREEELRAETANVLESINEGYVAFDGDFHYTAVNDKGLAIINMTREELIGRNMFELFPDTKGTIVEENYRKALEQQIPVHFRFFYDAWQRWFEVGAFPSKDGGLEVYFRDISQRATTDAILEGQKRALERAVNGAPLPQIMDILVRVIEDLSPGNAKASILLLDEETQTLRHCAAPALPDEYNAAIDGVCIGPQVGSCGTAAFTGERVVVSDIETDPLWKDFKDLALGFNLRACWSNPILSAQGAVLGTFAIYHSEPNQPSSEDEATVQLLTHTAALVIERDRERKERQEIAASLKEADRRKDEFLATLAHELRNPLAPIRTGLEVLRMAPDDKEQSRKVRKIMERQTEQMVRLIDDLLDISRITRGKFELQPDWTSIQKVLADAVEATRPFIDELSHELDVQIPEESIELIGDRHRLTQVFSNLLNNAAKYTPEGGKIRLSARRTNRDSVEIFVEDNGDGISKEMHEQIFDMFTQIHSNPDISIQGLGIGLTLVKSLVEMHDGSVKVESEGPGQGSKFIVSIPLPSPNSDIDNTDEKSAGNGTLVHHEDEKQTVLVVDDNQTAAETLALFFELEGYPVDTAKDGADAVKMFQNNTYSIVLMDIGMPEMDGIEAAKRIRALPGGKDAYLIALTGWGQEKDRQKTREAGYDHHLVKPVEPATLRELLAEKST
ncbi:MAG: response regulator [Verrucomicrobiales bacterium]|nr:response regulator [Verrucomicrobiales bacterium]